jgi:thiamine-monophosphate kinase
MAGFDEFSLIKRLFLPLTGGHAAALGLADDVALVDGPPGQQWAMTTDAIVAGVHFFPDDAPDLIARKLIRVNLSDLAAKGAVPRFILLSACFPQRCGLDWLDRFALGLKSDCQHFDLVVIGGDTVATPGPLTLSLTAIGQLPRGQALLRSNARSGDTLWVSGTLGDAALGLLVAKGEAFGLSPAHAEFLLDRYHLPQPRLRLGKKLLGLAHAAMDLSDGLMADLAHLCDASRLGAVVEEASLPLSPAARAAIALQLGGGLEAAAAGGDDYEILFTAPPDQDRRIALLAQTLELQLTPIGRMTPDLGAVLLQGRDGRPVALSRRGYQHFTGQEP